MNQTGSPPPQALELTRFWQESGPDRWFVADPAFDAAIRQRFAGLVDVAGRGTLDDWQESREGALALLLLLDQFPRNLFRGTARAFATDEQARRVASAALARSFDSQTGPDLRQFFYLPFMHSEDVADQDRSIALYEVLFAETGGESLHYAQLHRDIIVRFGRFPHRNAALGRASTTAELDFLAQGGFKG